MQTSCPNCKQVLEVTDELIGQTVQCPTCITFTIPVAVSGNQGCPSCGHKTETGDAFCVNCGTLITPSLAKTNIGMADPVPPPLPPHTISKDKTIDEASKLKRTMKTSIPYGMIRCSVCNEIISKGAKACPKCGDLKRKYGCFRWGCGGVLLFIVLVWMITEGIRGALKSNEWGVSPVKGAIPKDQNQDYNTTPPVVTTDGVQQDRTEEGLKKQEAVDSVTQVSFDDSEWAIVKVVDKGNILTPPNEFVKEATTEGKFIKVTYCVFNKTKTEERLLAVPRLADDQNRKFNQFDRQDGFLNENEKSMTLVALPAGIWKTFTAIYEVPSDVKGLKFEARSLNVIPSLKYIPLDPMKDDHATVYQ